jgi:hypothetical protein
MSSLRDETANKQTIERELEPLAPADRLPFLAMFEQTAKREGRLDWLRAIKEYRAFLSMQRPPKD